MSALPHHRFLRQQSMSLLPFDLMITVYSLHTHKENYFGQDFGQILEIYKP